MAEGCSRWREPAGAFLKVLEPALAGDRRRALPSNLGLVERALPETIYGAPHSLPPASQAPASFSGCDPKLRKAPHGARLCRHAYAGSLTLTSEEPLC
jgi:hypothetical protein